MKWGSAKFDVLDPGLYSIEFDREHLRLLTKALTKNTQLSYLCFESSYGLDDEALGALFEVLKTHKSLSQLFFRDCKIVNAEALESQEYMELAGEATPGIKSLKSLAETIKYNGVLEEIAFVNAEMNPEGITYVFGALQNNQGLKTVTFTGCEIDDESVISLAQALKVNSVLSHVNLEKNNIGDKGALALSDALKFNHTLREINLKKNKIGNVGALALAEAWQNNANLKDIALLGNPITGKGALALTKIAKDNKLYLPDYQLTDEDGVAIAEELRRNSSVTSLSFSNIGPTSQHNHLGMESARAFAKLLQHEHYLTELNFSGNELGDEGVQILAKALETDHTLQTLSLCSVGLSLNGAKALASALKVNRTLIKLGIDYNYLGDEGIQALMQALVINQTLQSIGISDAVSKWHDNTTTISASCITAITTAVLTNQTLRAFICNNYVDMQCHAQMFYEVFQANKTLTSIKMMGGNFYKIERVNKKLVTEQRDSYIRMLIILASAMQSPAKHPRANITQLPVELFLSIISYIHFGPLHKTAEQLQYCVLFVFQNIEALTQRLCNAYGKFPLIKEVKPTVKEKVSFRCFSFFKEAPSQLTREIRLPRNSVFDNDNNDEIEERKKKRKRLQF